MEEEKKIVFYKSGASFVNEFFIDFTPVSEKAPKKKSKPNRTKQPKRVKRKP